MGKYTEKSLFLCRTFDLANLSRGKNSPNPMVGAVITYNNKIIGEGFHEKYGCPHAEINALRSIANKNLLAKSSIFVSLEPCFHTGKTPPCVQAILKNQFNEVVVSVQDLNPLTGGKSIALLREKGITVKTNLLAQAGHKLISHFATNLRHKRPYIILKYAVSDDGFIGQSGKQVWLSNAFSKRLVHLWRSKLDAILVGGNTVRVDNPRLSARYFERRDPIKVVLSKSGNLPKEAHVFKDKATIIATTNPQTVQIDSDYMPLGTSPDCLTTFMEQLLTQKKIGSILIEGGAHTLQSFIDAGLWDEARIIRTSKTLKFGISQPTLENAILTERYPMGSDEIVIYQRKNATF